MGQGRNQLNQNFIIDILTLMNFSVSYYQFILCDVIIWRIYYQPLCCAMKQIWFPLAHYLYFSLLSWFCEVFWQLFSCVVEEEAFTDFSSCITLFQQFPYRCHLIVSFVNKVGRYTVIRVQCQSLTCTCIWTVGS